MIATGTGLSRFKLSFTIQQPGHDQLALLLLTFDNRFARVAKLCTQAACPNVERPVAPVARHRNWPHTHTVNSCPQREHL
jgi:hypothetical protein